VRISSSETKLYARKHSGKSRKLSVSIIIKYNGVQQVDCNPFPAKPFHSSHRLDIVMIRPPGIDNGAFVVSPDTVGYARALLMFSASAMTDTGTKTFECALVSSLETYDDPENGNYYIFYIDYINYICCTS
jgi:hypothetical protein